MAAAKFSIPPDNPEQTFSETSPPMSEYRKHTLSNGLRVVTVEMPHLHSIEILCYVKVGGRDETTATAGISHFLEHMLFRGTAEFSSSLHLEEAFEEIGGAVNASTDSETSCYHSRLHPGRLKEGVELFASMLRRPLLQEIETERRIILEEALEDLNEDGETINPDTLSGRLLWPGHPLGLPTIGTRKTIESFDLNDLRRHHATFYRPANTVIALAGRLEHQAATAAVEDAFGSWEAGDPPPSPLPAPAVREERPEMAWVDDSDSQLSVQIAFRMPGRQSPHVVALRVLRRLLSWGGTSRLMLQLRERLGLTYHVEANLALHQECGCFTVDLSLAPENLVSAMRELLEIFADIRRRPPEGRELSRVIRTYLYDLDFSRDHTDDMAIRYGWGELVGYLRTLEEDRRAIAAITPEDLQATARELFSPSRLKVVVVGPYRAKDRSRVKRLLEEYR